WLCYNSAYTFASSANPALIGVPPRSLHPGRTGRDPCDRERSPCRRPQPILDRRRARSDTGDLRLGNLRNSKCLAGLEIRRYRVRLYRSGKVPRRAHSSFASPYLRLNGLRPLFLHGWRDNPVARLLSVTRSGRRAEQVASTGSWSSFGQRCFFASV